MLNSYIDRQNIEENCSKLPRKKLSKIFDSDVISKLRTIHKLLLEIKEKGYYELYDFGRVALSASIWSLTENGSNVDINNSFCIENTLYLGDMLHSMIEMNRVLKKINCA